MTPVEHRDQRLLLALDLGGTLMRAALVRSDGALVGRRARPTPRADASTVVAACVDLLRQTLAEVGASGTMEAVVLGVSAPGPLDPRHGRLIDPPNLDHSLWDFPLADALSDALGLPVSVERDTQLAALAEGAFGAGRGLSDYVYLTISTGIGGAVVTDGRLLRGADGLFGELGHLTVDVNGPPCGCGAHGHLEAVASGTAIARAARAAGLGEIDARDVARAEQAGDRQAAAIMQRARDAFASALVSIVDVFNPQRVIVGGGLAAGEGDRLLGPARERIRAHAFRRQAARVEVVPAELGDDVGLVGAMLLVRDTGQTALADLGAVTDDSVDHYEVVTARAD
jgi:glucokinase